MKKTLRSRIAAVVVATLGAGLLSVAPASANSTCNPSNQSGCTTTGGGATWSGTLTTGGSSSILTNATASAPLAVGSVTIALAGITRNLESSNPDEDEIELSLSGTGFTFDETVTSPNTTNGTLNFQNATTVTVKPTNDGATASATIPVRLSAARQQVAGSNVATVAVSGWNSGVGAPVYSAPQTFTITVGSSISRTNTLSASSATVAPGTSTTFTVADASTMLASSTSTLAIASANSGVSVSAAVGTATGGTALVTLNPDYQNVTITNYKNLVSGAYSVTHTITVTVLPGTGTGVYTVTAGTKTFTLTVVPTVTTPVYGTTVVSSLTAVSPAVKDGLGVVYADKMANYMSSAVATFTVTQKDQFGTDITSPAYAKPITVSLTGVGSLDAIASAGVISSSQTKIVLATAIGTTYSNGIVPFSVYSDGRAGTATVTVSIDGVVVRTRTVKFYGAATKVAATPIYTIGQAAGGTTGDTTNTNVSGDIGTATSATDPALAVLVTDANGTPIPVRATAVSSNALIVSGVNFGFIDSGLGDYTAGTFMQHFSFSTYATATSGKSATATFSVVNPDGSVVSSTPVTLTVGSAAVASVTFAFDKASYAPGEKVSMTVTAKDASGNPVADNVSLATLLATATGSTALQGSFPGVNITFVGGVKKYTLYAPLSAGTFSVNGSYLDGTKVTASATVVVDTSAIDAVKADLAKTQAAITALSATITSIQTAMATLVASTTATLTALTAKINKIMAKFKIK